MEKQIFHLLSHFPAGSLVARNLSSVQLTSEWHGPSTEGVFHGLARRDAGGWARSTAAWNGTSGADTWWEGGRQRPSARPHQPGGVLLLRFLLLISSSSPPLPPSFKDLLSWFPKMAHPPLD